ncbi:MAG: low molecular weight phosphotyrosine protein phosphatase, partial [Proteobacteria bacterium]|nr:low molecular weight phosphotyrosine protein phosphatase [Pseudomonadota bacterium]
MAEVGVLFVCTGNICRSPSAEGVARKLLIDAGLDARVAVDSAGLGGWHVGEPPDPRAIESARRRGYDLSAQRARQFGRADFDDFALIVGMDRGHVAQLRARRPRGAAGEVRLFLEFLTADDPGFGDDVPDPYYGGMADYEL